MTSLSLRRIILYKAGQDLRRCRSCGVCSEYMFSSDDVDIAMGTMVQLVLLNDPEVFTCWTIWSGEVMEVAETLCPNGINLATVIQTLREEAVLRGLV
ncbi:MAG TPA: hypothetical protein VI451_18795 [Anaerolineales bacterium]|nr:hypothetical protein [Anaerolineales bacterium]